MNGAHNEEIELGGEKYYPNTIRQKCIVHWSKKVVRNNNPCFVYYHGGGAVGGDCTQNIPHCNRIAMECNATVINCNYRLAPEGPAPQGIDDAYAILLDILANAASLKINPSRVVIYGESGGGYICAGVSMRLAENNLSHKIKFSFQQIPMVDWFFIKKVHSPPLNDIEQAAVGFHEGVYNLLTPPEWKGND